MTLSQRAESALAGLGNYSGSERTLDVAEADLRLRCDLTATDTLGCAFTQFEVHSSKLANASIDQLKKVSEALAARLTYLLEPIKLIEVDADQCVAQLRSSPPQREPEMTTYYELLVRRGGELSLCRWSKTRTSERQLVPAQVTREVFLRLVADFSAAAG